MIRVEAAHLGVGIGTDLLARLNDAGPDTVRKRDLYLQTVLHIVAENRIDLTARPDEIEALAAPSHHGIPDADVLVDLDIFDRTDDGYRLAHVDVFQVPAPGPRRSRPAAILGYASTQQEPFSPADIADLLGIDVGLAGNYLGKLHRDGRLDRVGRGRYTLATSTVDDAPPDPQTSDHNPVDNSVDHTKSVIEREINAGVIPAQSPPRARATKEHNHLESKTLKTNPKATTQTQKQLQTTTNQTTKDLKNLTTTTEVAELAKYTECKTRQPRRIPLPFTVDESMRAWAQTRVPYIDIDTETEDFVDYWASKSTAATKIDWVRTWQMWMRRATRYSHSALHLPRPTETSWRPPECPPDMDLYGDEYAELKRASKAAWRAARAGART